MIKAKITIANNAGLHARAAARLVGITSGFRCSVKIGGDKLVDGKSILSLMMLAANKGTELNVIVDGEDEQEALQAVNALVENLFDEGQ
jgi:phosphocarrier protein HPr